MTWNPDQYDRFLAQRSRPARDLVAALPPLSPRRILDLGCGTGQLARNLAERWPEAETTGLDGSAEMLARAAAIPSRVRWVRADLNGWAPPAPVDLVVSNAALHWLSDHAALFPRLLGWLAPGGVLAVQMPRNYHSPSYQAVRAVAADPRWRDRLSAHPLLGPAPVHPPERYCDWLQPRTRVLEIWETEYLQILSGPDPVLGWLRGTTLLPVAEALPTDAFAEFEAQLRERLAAAYPARADGTALFPFRRLFLIAVV